MINILSVWGLLFAILVGWGLATISLLRRLGGITLGGTLSTFQTMWLGYGALLVFLEFASLLLPIADLVLYVSLVPALAGYATQRRTVVRRLRAIVRGRRSTAVVAVVVFVSCVMVAYVSWDSVMLYDTGLYHLQSVKWIARHAAVPGLANLHLRFGYNNSVHVFAAYLDAFWEGTSAHLTNGFLMAALLGQWFTEILTARTPRQRLRQTFCLLSLPFVLSRVGTLEIASLSSDQALAMITFVLVLELVSLQPASRQRHLPLALIALLGAVAATTKLGGLAICGVACVLVFWLSRRNPRALMTVFALPVLVVSGWMARGVVASGWLLFPVFGRLPLAWSVPPDVAHAHMLEIESWARVTQQSPEQVFGHGYWHWFGPWLDGFRTTHEFVLIVVSFALLAWRLMPGAVKSAARSAGEWSAIVGCMIGIAQWFFSVPGLRYGAYLIWLLPAALLAPMIADVMREATKRTLVFVLSLGFCIWAGAFALRVDSTPPKLWGRPPAPMRVSVKRVTSSPGLDVLFPQEGDQCFDEDLPCTPTPGAHAREPGSLASGFLPP